MIYELEDRKPVLEGDNFVAPNAAVIGAVVLKRGANVWFGVTIRGDNDAVTIGENVNVQDGSVIHTDRDIPCVLGNNVSVGHMVMLHGCTIGDGSLIGMGAIILNRAVIGKDCLIAAGALITEGKHIPDGSLVMGAPGKVVRPLTSAELANNAWIAGHYVERAAMYRKGLRPAA